MQQQPRSRQVPEEPIYSIRAGTGAEVSCAVCGRAFSGSGPVGYRDDESICDPCLLDADPMLGLVLALVAVNRSYGAMTRGRGGEVWDALEQVGFFARVFESVAGKVGPIRRFPIPGIDDEDLATPSE